MGGWQTIHDQYQTWHDTDSMMKKTYNKPTLNIVLLKSSTHLLTGSEYQVNSYQDGGTTTVGDDEE